MNCSFLLEAEAERKPWSVPDFPATAARVQQHRRAVLVVIFGVVCAHLAEILLYAMTMYVGTTLGLGTLTGTTHPHAVQYFYLSAETFTTLGLGDIYPTDDLRLIASLEPLIGMLLIGWSGSYTYLAVQRYWADLQAPAPVEPKEHLRFEVAAKQAWVPATSRHESRPLTEDL